MEEGEIVVAFLVPTNQDPTKAVHPTMSAFHHPPPSSDTRLLFERVRFFAPRPQMRGEAKHCQRGPHLRIVVPFIQTQTLGVRRGGFGPLDHEAIEGGGNQFHVRPIGAGHDYSQWDPMALGQQAAFDPAPGYPDGLLGKY